MKSEIVPPLKSNETAIIMQCLFLLFEKILFRRLWNSVNQISGGRENPFKRQKVRF